MRETSSCSHVIARRSGPERLERGTLVAAGGIRELVKVRIKVSPAEREIDGVSLDRFTPGAVREVSASIASWLIAEGYAAPEMRSTVRDDERRHSSAPAGRELARDRRKRGR